MDKKSGQLKTIGHWKEIKVLSSADNHNSVIISDPFHKAEEQRGMLIFSSPGCSFLFFLSTRWPFYLHHGYL